MTTALIALMLGLACAFGGFAFAVSFGPVFKVARAHVKAGRSQAHGRAASLSAVSTA